MKKCRIVIFLIIVMSILTGCACSKNNNTDMEKKTSKPSASVSIQSSHNAGSGYVYDNTADNSIATSTNKITGSSIPNAESTASANTTENNSAVGTQSAKPSSNASANTNVATAKPTTSSTFKSTVKPTATDTAKPTNVSTATPTATPKPTAKPTGYPWSDSVTTYLTDSSRGKGEYIPKTNLVTLKDRAFASSLSNTVFGDCASYSYQYDLPGISTGAIGEAPKYEAVNKNGVIAQLYLSSWWDYQIGSQVEGKKVTGLYLDTSYSIANAEIKEFTGRDTVDMYWDTLTAVNGTTVKLAQPYMSPGKCLVYPLSNGKFVINYHGAPIILNFTPQNVRVYTGMNNVLQIAVDGKVVFEGTVDLGAGQ